MFRKLFQAAREMADTAGRSLRRIEPMLGTIVDWIVPMPPPKPVKVTARHRGRNASR